MGLELAILIAKMSSYIRNSRGNTSGEREAELLRTGCAVLMRLRVLHALGSAELEMAPKDSRAVQRYM